MSDVSRHVSAIVLDKSFLQGSKVSRIHELAKTHRLIVSDALFYELLTSSEGGRSRCFLKFPQAENPVDLVSHIGALMRLEIDTHSPCGKPSEHREKLRFQFNPQLLRPDYILPEEARVTIQERTAELRSDVLTWHERAALIPIFFPNLLVGSHADQAHAYAKAEQALSEQRSLIPFYTQLEPRQAKNPFRPLS